MAEYEPLVIERAEGCRLFDIDGREYLDGASSMWCNVHGHRHPRIDAAMREQLDRVAHCTSLGMGCDTTVRLAKRLADLAPGDLEHVFFSSDGSSAVEVALKMAFQYWRQCPTSRGRKKQVHCAVAKRITATRSAARASAASRGFRAFSGRCCSTWSECRCPIRAGCQVAFAPSAAAAFFSTNCEPLLQAHHQEIAALVIEPLVQCAAGMVMHPPGYLARRARAHQGIRRALDCRRNRRWHGSHRYDVRLRAGRCRARFPVPRQRTYGRLPADGRHDHARRNLSRLPGQLMRMRERCTTVTRTAAIRWRPRRRWPRSMCSTKNKRWPNCRQRSRDWASICADWRSIRTSCRTRQRGLIGALELTPDKATGVPYPAEERRGWRVCREALDARRVDSPAWRTCCT